MTVAKLLVDGGGTRTRAALCHNGGIQCSAEGASCNPRSVGRQRALANLSELVNSLWRDRSPGVESLDSTWLCLSTASSLASLNDFASALLASPPTPIRGTQQIWVTNDIAPLLVHDGRIVKRVVAICGTGTGFCSINPEKGLSAHASGQEYLLADEGGGFDLGLQGLRAVIRAKDGRGTGTSLTEALMNWRGVTAEQLFDLVYDASEPKVLVASFAPFVLTAAEKGDACATRIIAGAVNELVAGIEAVARRAELSGAFEVLLAGSILVGQRTILRDRLKQAIHEVMPEASTNAMRTTNVQAIAHFAEILPKENQLMAILRYSLPLLRLDDPALQQ